MDGESWIEEIFYQNAQQKIQTLKPPYILKDLHKNQLKSSNRHRVRYSNNNNKFYSQKYRAKRNNYIRKLQIQVQSLTLQLKLREAQISKLMYKPDYQILFYQDMKKYHFDELKTAFNQEKLNQKQILEQKLPKYLQYEGLIGKQKIQLLNFHFSEIMNNILSSSHKFLVCSVLQKFGNQQIFGEMNPILNDIEDKIMNILNINSTDLLSKQLNIGQIINEECQNFHQQSKNFYRCYLMLLKQIQNINKKKDIILKNIQNKCSLQNRLKVSLFLKNRQHSVQMKKLKQCWFKSLQVNSYSDNH